MSNVFFASFGDTTNWEDGSGIFIASNTIPPLASPTPVVSFGSNVSIFDTDGAGIVVVDQDQNVQNMGVVFVGRVYMSNFCNYYLIDSAFACAGVFTRNNDGDSLLAPSQYSTVWFQNELLLDRDNEDDCDVNVAGLVSYYDDFMVLTVDGAFLVSDNGVSDPDYYGTIVYETDNSTFTFNSEVVFDSLEASGLVIETNAGNNDFWFNDWVGITVDVDGITLDENSDANQFYFEEDVSIDAGEDGIVLEFDSDFNEFYFNLDVSIVVGDEGIDLSDSDSNTFDFEGTTFVNAGTGFEFTFSDSNALEFAGSINVTATDFGIYFNSSDSNPFDFVGGITTISAASSNAFYLSESDSNAFDFSGIISITASSTDGIVVSLSSANNFTFVG